MTLNALIGVPFALNRKDFKGCDCRGIVCLYYEYVKNRIIPFSDGKRILFRNPKKDYERMVNKLKTFSEPVVFEDLTEGDIILLKAGKKNIGAMGVCINDRQALHMDKFVGSCLTKIKYLKELFLTAYRPI